jgi:transglycosylase-like protein
MRRRIATVFSVVLIATPAAIALAAETNEEGTQVSGTLAGARDGQLSHARVNAKRERQEDRERRRRARRVRKAAGTTAAAPAAAQGGGSTASPQLEAIAACESGGNPSAIGGGGQFRGKYQFTYETWAAVGGSGDPAAAPEAEQDRRAAILLAQSGTSPWPVCGG